MSGSSLASSTNQRLDAARRLLSQSQQGEDSWLASSFENSALFQLRSALNGLLQEIQSVYSLKGELSVTAMVQLAATKGVIVPALQELQLLQENRQSWLSQLYSGYVAALECTPNVGAVSANSGSDLIGKGSDSGAATKHILNSLVDIVLRFREDSAEY
ncbi:DUF6586 family protein [Rhodanobacter aciditrophus]|uniref:DUF6586 family protein n=1 Tax=Rhodanobacter aciditrophus TaxID=1623218 RepID=A0ABW4B5F7_9GAMM